MVGYIHTEWKGNTNVLVYARQQLLQKPDQQIIHE